MEVWDKEAAMQSLSRLIALAANDSGQATRVRRFLLSWWNASTFGGFDPTDMWGLDHTIQLDVLSVIKLIVHTQSYPDILGFKTDFDWLIVRYHPQVIDPIERECIRYQSLFERRHSLGLDDHPMQCKERTGA